MIDNNNPLSSARHDRLGRINSLLGKIKSRFNALRRETVMTEMGGQAHEIKGGSSASPEQVQRENSTQKILLAITGEFDDDSTLILSNQHTVDEDNHQSYQN